MTRKEVIKYINKELNECCGKNLALIYNQIFSKEVTYNTETEEFVEK